MKKEISKDYSENLYLKYRPSEFLDVIGQEEVVSVLENSIKNENIAHAYLFSGTHGTGKTSLARIFANKIGSKADDIYEIDAASNRGISEIRDIRDSVEILPLNSKYKVYIIDEAHMLTKEASNALLKTLEEPPRHVVFILATTEKYKVLPTIVSRCLSFEFNSPNIENLSRLIKKVSKEEERSIDDKSVEFIAGLGKKSFRDTLSNLQKVFSIFDKKIEFEKLKKVFSDSSEKIENDFLIYLSEKNKEKVFETYYKVNEQGLNLKFFIENILEKMRKSLLIRNSKSFLDKYEKELTKDEFEFFKKIKINSLIFKNFLNIFEEMNLSGKPDILFEIFLEENI